MDISLDQTLENSEKHPDNLNEGASDDLLRDGQTSIGEGQPPGGLYQLRSNDNGQVTYRVVQVGGSDNDQQATLSIVSTNGIQNLLSPGGSGNGAPQVAFVSNSFNEGGESNAANVSSDNQAAKFAYFSSTGSSSSSGAQEIASQATDQGVSQGQFYVMMSPQDVLQGTPSTKHQLAPKSQYTLQKLDGGRGNAVMRDTTRRVQHNEVERRRRDKINNWIMKLSKVVPDCAGDHSKQGQSKGGILAKTCDYILDLQNQNRQRIEAMKELERLQEELDVTRHQLKEKKQENAILHQALRSHGIAVDIKSTSNMTQ